MSLFSKLIIAAGAVGFYLYKKDVDERIRKQEEDQQKILADMLDKVQEAEDKVNPNGSANQAPITMSATVKMGGITLNQLEVWLNIRNNSNAPVEIGDFRSRIFVGGVRSERVMPSNISHFIIPANKIVRVRLYARGDVAYPNNYNEVRRLLAPLCGSSGISIPNYTTIPLEKSPVELDIQYLWYWKGGEEECVNYDVKGDFMYRFATWTVGSYEGYNAGNKNQQQRNPSYWEKYDEQPIDEE